MLDYFLEGYGIKQTFSKLEMLKLKKSRTETGQWIR